METLTGSTVFFLFEESKSELETDGIQTDSAELDPGTSVSLACFEDDFSGFWT